jgi:hypothetical protein
MYAVLVVGLLTIVMLALDLATAPKQSGTSR